MGKHNRNQAKKDNALPKADVEFAEARDNGLEKIALKAQRGQNK